MSLEPGLNGTTDHTVTADDTAVAFGSGTVPVLSTPRVLAWLEAACLAALDGHLADGETTVGMRTQFDHLRPSVVGAAVRCTAALERVEGRRLTFAVSAHDGDDEIAAGHLTRVVVDQARFLDRAGVAG